MRDRLVLSRAVLFVGLLSCSLLLRPNPIDLDTQASFAGVLGVALLFSVFAWSVHSCGAILSRSAALPSSLPYAIGLGTIFFALLGLLMGTAGVLGVRQRAYVLLFMGLLCSVGPPRSTAGSASDRVFFPRDLLKQSLPALITLGVILVAFGFALARGLVPQLHTDPLWDHLLGARLWSQSGRIETHYDHPLLFKAGPWEVLYLWGFTLVGGHEYRGILDGLLFSQLTHLTLGLGGTLLGVATIARVFAKSAKWVYLATLPCISSGFLSWTSMQAKNDWGSFLWLSLGLAALAGGDSPRQVGKPRFLLGGIFLGTAFFSKYSLAPLVLIVGSALVARSVQTGRAQSPVRAALGVLLGSAPWLLRNYAFTGSPFFPIETAGFKSPFIGASYGSQLSLFQGFAEIQWRSLIEARVALIQKEETFSMLAAVSPVGALLVWLGCSTGDRSLLRGLRPASFWRWTVLLSPLLATAVFVARMGPPLSFGDGTLNLRIIAPGFVLCSAFGILGLQRTARIAESAFGWRGLSSATHSVLLASFLVVMQGNSLDPVAAAVRARSYPHDIPIANEFAQLHSIGGLAKAWLRQNASRNELIVTTGDIYFLFLSSHHVTSLGLSPYLDRRVGIPFDVESGLETLYSVGTRFLFDTHHFEGRFWGRFAERFDPWSARHPEALLYANERDTVIDFPKFYGEVRRACVAKPEFGADYYRILIGE